MTSAKEIAKLLLDIKAVTVRTNPPFTWASGIKAPIYCDNRLLISYPQERWQIIDCFIALIKEKKIEFDVIGGTATAAIPWAAFLSYELNVPMVYIRPEQKDHGKGKQVEGTIPSGSKVLIVEDLISTGGSSIKSAQACIREYHAQVSAVLAIFTYEMQKATAAFQEAGITPYALSSFSTLLSVAIEEKCLKPNEKMLAESWSADPENWKI